MSKSEMDLVVVIMAGGTGTRFWPLSTEEIPKQFLTVFGDRSLLQKSYDRICDLVPPERVLILTNASFVSMVKEQLPQIPKENIIGEPMRRDTAAAVALAALLTKKRFGPSVMATLTADHLISPVSEFQKSLLSAIKFAQREEILYTFGIEPTFPATGYGYLERGKQVADDDGIEHFELTRFKEKPDAQTAAAYVASGRYYWNSGMFVWATDTILKALKNHLPNHIETIQQAVELDATGGWEKALYDAFSVLPKISIDFGVMEKAEKVFCVAGKFAWSDVGGWLSLGNCLEKDESGNACQCDVLSCDATNNIVFCQDSKEPILLVGVHDLVIARTKNGTLIAHKERTEDIKKLVEAMGKK